MTMDNDASANAMREARIAEYWYSPEPGASREGLAYRPAVLVDCSVNFRSLKAGINHSEERSYTSWLPSGSLPVDWDMPALERVEAPRLASRPEPDVAPSTTRPSVDLARFDELETDLIEALVRREKLVLFYNPLFEVFSAVGEPLNDFLDRSAEIALQQIEPELKQLKHVFELQLEQVREAHISKRGVVPVDGANAPAANSKAEIERLLQSRTEFFAVEKRITSLFTGLAGFVLRMPLTRQLPSEDGAEAALELREDLARVEQEAADALNELYTRYLEMVRSYDAFEVRVPHGNVRLQRRALLWVPVRRHAAENANPRE
jgi:hypothetical protein